MSLGIAFKGTEGIVLAADSRVTLLAQIIEQKHILSATFDNATKLLRVSSQGFVGAVTYGLGALGVREPRTAHSYMPEFEAQLNKEVPYDSQGQMKRLTVKEFADKLSGFFLNQWTRSMPPNVPPGQDMIFLVGGYDAEQPYGNIYEIRIPSSPSPVELIPGQFGAAWGGQREFTDRLISGFDPRLLDIVKDSLNLSPEQTAKIETDIKAKLNLSIPYQFLPLQDCVDLSIFLIRTTITLQKWLVGVRGVGGFIDVAVITKTEPFKPIQQKQITGEKMI